MNAKQNMMFTSVHEPSYAPKITMFVCLILGSVIGLRWGLAPESWSAVLDRPRLLLQLACVLIYFLRQVPVFFVFLKRRVSWSETAMISAIMGFVMGLICYRSSQGPPALTSWDYLWLLLFLVGSIMHTGVEWSRYRFKRDPANKGKLYKTGLARFGQNMNYTGDLVLFSGMAMLSGDYAMLLVPFFMTVNFIFILLPEKESYLKSHYPEEWPEYAARTKRLIPWIY